MGHVVAILSLAVFGCLLVTSVWLWIRELNLEPLLTIAGCVCGALSIVVLVKHWRELRGLFLVYLSLAISAGVLTFATTTVLEYERLENIAAGTEP